MQYFVSIENKINHHWQIELLIQSFKLLNLEKNLVIGIAKNDSPSSKEYTQNLKNHENKFFHENIGCKKNNLKLNKYYSLLLAIKNGIISYPFVLIHSDMLINKNIINNYSEDLIIDSDSLLKDKILEPIQKHIPYASQNLKEIKWKSPGDIFLFNKEISGFIERVFQWMEFLNDFPELEKSSFLLTLIEFQDKISVLPTIFQSTLLHFDYISNFIHYSHGIPTVFHKKYFDFENKFFMCDSSPYNILLQHNPTINTDYVQKVINSRGKNEVK